MDSTDDTRARPSLSPFREAYFANSASSPSDALLVVIPDFSLDQPFGDPEGVVWSPTGGALPQAGDRALVAESTDGTWWVVSWWSGQQGTGVAQASVDALDVRLDALEATRIIRGTVSSAGAVVVGSGFSAARNGTGDYTVTFTAAFSGVPSVTLGLGASVGANAIKIKNSVAVTAGSVSVYTYVAGGAFADSDFHFIAAGPA